MFVFEGNAAMFKISGECELRNNAFLIYCEPKNELDFDYVLEHFVGARLNLTHKYLVDSEVREKADIVFLAGNIRDLRRGIYEAKEIYVVKEFSYNYEPSECTMSMGQLPLDIMGVGILYRKYFEDDVDWFEKIEREHKFQNLTESNKQGQALRTGLYITNVDSYGSDSWFKLLRCSSNFTGPTENLRETDKIILARLNHTAQFMFHYPAELNHILAQIYNNTTTKKAAIKDHSDKTKDMSESGIIAFCTFYDEDSWHEQIKTSETDVYDKVYKKTSVLSELKFTIKSDVDAKSIGLVDEFTVKLYPGSVFLIPLSTNRLYTHQIKPSVLPVEYLPKRMGYVVRCSKTNASHSRSKENIDENGDGRTYIKVKNTDEEWILKCMNRPTEEDLNTMRSLYYKENTTSQIIDYGQVVYSMNDGDYMMPIA